MRCAKQNVEAAVSTNIIERCQKYLSLLTAYRDELYKFRGTPEIDRYQKSLLAREAIDNVRKEIRAAVETATRERNKIEALLKSFTAISGYEALETLNRCQYKGFNNWELKAGGVKHLSGTEADKISIQEAVVIASLLRRSEYLTLQTTIEN